MTPTAGGRRHCERCDREVHDLHGVSEARVRALLALRGPDGLCARQVVDDDGELVLALPPRPARAGLLAGLLASALLGPQAEAQEPPPSAEATCDGSGASPTGTTHAETSATEAPPPAEPLAQVVRLGAVVSSGAPYISTRLSFKSGKADLQPADQDFLRELAQVLAENPEIPCVTLVGSTSSREVQDPVALGLRRAEAARAALIALGVQPERLAVRSNGDQLPVADNHSAEGRAANRHVSFVVGDGADCAAP